MNKEIAIFYFMYTGRCNFNCPYCAGEDSGAKKRISDFDPVINKQVVKKNKEFTIRHKY